MCAARLDTAGPSVAAASAAFSPRHVPTCPAPSLSASSPRPVAAVRRRLPASPSRRCRGVCWAAADAPEPAAAVSARPSAVSLSSLKLTSSSANVVAVSVVPAAPAGAATGAIVPGGSATMRMLAGTRSRMGTAPGCGMATRPAPLGLPAGELPPTAPPAPGAAVVTAAEPTAVGGGGPAGVGASLPSGAGPLADGSVGGLAVSDDGAAAVRGILGDLLCERRRA